jgi:hypothetical protein
VKYEDYPLRRQQEDAPKELDSQLTQLENTNRIEAMRYPLEEVCLQVATDLQSADDQLKELGLDPLQPEITVIIGTRTFAFASMDYEEKRLGLEVLNVSVTLTDNHVEVNAVLGVEEPDSRLITTGQTSASLCTGNYNFKAIYVLHPVAKQVL